MLERHSSSVSNNSTSVVGIPYHIYIYNAGTGSVDPDGVDARKRDQSNHFEHNVIRIYFNGCQHKNIGGGHFETLNEAFPDLNVGVKKLESAITDGVLDLNKLREQFGNAIAAIEYVRPVRIENSHKFFYFIGSDFIEPQAMKPDQIYVSKNNDAYEFRYKVGDEVKTWTITKKDIELLAKEPPTYSSLTEFDWDKLMYNDMHETNEFYNCMTQLFPKIFEAVEVKQIQMQSATLDGYSRGGISALAQARALNQYKIPIHVLPNQAVPGVASETGELFKRYKDLTDCENIESVTMLFADHDTRNDTVQNWFFKQMRVRFPEKTKQTMQLLPLQHHFQDWRYNITHTKGHDVHWLIKKYHVL